VRMLPGPAWWGLTAIDAFKEICPVHKYAAQTTGGFRLATSL
jgi:hypothetical protein